MNKIQFTEKGFVLVYPDRKEKWEKVREVDVIEGLDFIKYKGYMYLKRN